MIAAIPTKYSGVQFRSRLEARWAAFFDEMGWTWRYEPIDLRGWIPDFIVECPGELAVEIKPALKLDDLYSFVDKIESSGWRSEVLLAGSGLFGIPADSPANGGNGFVGELALGLSGEWGEWLHPGAAELRGGFSWAPAFAFRCKNCGRLTFGNDLMSYRCRIGGCHDGDHFISFDSRADFENAWNNAGNAVQWKSPR